MTGSIPTPLVGQFGRETVAFAFGAVAAYRQPAKSNTLATHCVKLINCVMAQAAALQYISHSAMKKASMQKQCTLVLSVHHEDQTDNARQDGMREPSSPNSKTNTFGVIQSRATCRCTIQHQNGRLSTNILETHLQIPPNELDPSCSVGEPLKPEPELLFTSQELR